MNLPPVIFRTETSVLEVFLLFIVTVCLNKWDKRQSRRNSILEIQWYTLIRPPLVVDFVQKGSYSLIFPFSRVISSRSNIEKRQISHIRSKILPSRQYRPLWKGLIPAPVGKGSYSGVSLLAYFKWHCHSKVAYLEKDTIFWKYAKIKFISRKMPTKKWTLF